VRIFCCFCGVLCRAQVVPGTAKGEVRESNSGPLRAAGSTGDEWWRRDGLAPPRKGRADSGGMGGPPSPLAPPRPPRPATAQPAAQRSGKAAAAAKASLPKKEHASSKVAPKSPAKANARPKTAPAK
jgi:hypothetical protein